MENLTLDKTLQKCRLALEAYYGEKLQGILLYGSYARGDAVSSSDIDLLILLSPPFDFFAELRQIIEILYPIQLESEQLISAKPAPVNDFQIGSISLYRNIQAEGMAI